jgi:hypothetical protein
LSGLLVDARHRGPVVSLVQAASMADVADAMEEVRVAFVAFSKAQARFNRCRLPASREAARAEVEAAEKVYREAAQKRERVVAKAHGKVSP